MTKRASSTHGDLPGLGEWDGPIHGELGRLHDDGQRVACHACGRYFHHLAHHIRAHNLTPDEYRAAFGLNRSTGLVGPQLAGKFRVLAARLAPYRDVGRATLGALTHEQLVAAASRPRRLETRIKPANVEAWRRATAKASARQAELRASGWVGHRPTPEQGRAWGHRVQAYLRARRASDPAFDAARRRAISEGRGGKTTLHCAVCGRPFEVQPSRAPGRKLCGARECRAEAKRRQLAAFRDAPGARAKAAATRKAERAARLGTRPDGTVDAACCVCGAAFATRLRADPADVQPGVPEPAARPPEAGGTAHRRKAGRLLLIWYTRSNQECARWWTRLPSSAPASTRGRRSSRGWCWRPSRRSRPTAPCRPGTA